MKPQRITGPDAAVLKYDILTALSVIGLKGPHSLQTSVLRLIALVTARYNWRTDEFTVSQRDMARLWSVNERTVKREVKRLSDAQIIQCKRRGVRGRVGAYSLNYIEVARQSEPLWPMVGPDFVHRMQTHHDGIVPKVIHLANFQKAASLSGAEPGTWEKAMATIAQSHPEQFEAWFARLNFLSYENETLRLGAPSPFFQRYVETHLMTTLLKAVELEFGPVNQVQFH
ncbi:MAG: DnaA N-terminal domain-containing protein [Pseudomonadota bacterium]